MWYENLYGMKHYGSKFECEEERNDDLIRAYREQVRQCTVIYIPDIFKKVVDMPSRRFWVSEERAAIVIASMMRGDTLETMRQVKREMFTEIYRRVMAVREQCPTMSVYEMVSRVVRQPAPKFYLTAGSARVIYYRIKKDYERETMRRLKSKIQSKP